MSRIQIVVCESARRHGRHRGPIGDVLRSEGNEVVVADAARRPDPAGFDAYVVGSGVYMGSWLKEGIEFLDRQRETLATRPVWLFSSGPLPGSSKETDTADPLELALGPTQELVAAGIGGSPHSPPRSARGTTVSSWAPTTPATHPSRAGTHRPTAPGRVEDPAHR